MTQPPKKIPATSLGVLVAGLIEVERTTGRWQIARSQRSVLLRRGTRVVLTHPASRRPHDAYLVN